MEITRSSIGIFEAISGVWERGETLSFFPVSRGINALISCREPGRSERSEHILLFSLNGATEQLFGN